MTTSVTTSVTVAALKQGLGSGISYLQHGRSISEGSNHKFILNEIEILFPYETYSNYYIVEDIIEPKYGHLVMLQRREEKILSRQKNR